MNILFIMYDQLRFDYLGCAGHPTLKTPNFDRLAARGVRFTRCYTQSPICGAARMSFYTGRYVSSHGAAWNDFPLRVGERTMGDHLRDNGMDCWLIGKTHMRVDEEGMRRLGLSPDSVIGARQAECGFDVWTRDDGLMAQGPDGFYGSSSPYNDYLHERGYGGDNPWADFANAGVEDGMTASGWFMRHAARPANIEEQDSETPWLTRRAMAFIEQAKGPWCAHLSYIKPHWPYIVPAPWHDLYGRDDVQPPIRSEAERENPHPLFKAFMQQGFAESFSIDEVRETVIPAYMGLIAQCDAELGRLLDWLEATGRDKDTVIVLTSDHGDYLGDHWLGEKDMFHDVSARIPLIIYDPRPEADASRGTTSEELVEAIDLCATFIEIAGGKVPANIVEGRSLLPFLRGEQPEKWREVAISEYSYAQQPVRARLGVSQKDARMFMIADREWKLIHCEGGFRPMLYDLKNDPDELIDIGADPAHAGTIERLYDQFFRWARRDAQRVTVSDEAVEARFARGPRGKGVILGAWDENDVPQENRAYYHHPVPERPSN